MGTVTITPPNGDYQLCVIQQTGTNSGGGGGTGGSGIPTYWGLGMYPNPGTGQTQAQDTGGAGSVFLPYGTATENFRFFQVGGTSGTIPGTWPGTGLIVNSLDHWADASGAIYVYSWPGDGGPFASGSGLIPCVGLRSSTTAYTNQNIINGTVDNTIKGWVDQIWNAGYTKAFFRLDWEFEAGTSVPLSQSGIPTRLQAWYRMYSVLHSQAATHSGMQIWVGWNPDTGLAFTNYPLSTAYPVSAGNGYPANFFDVIMGDCYSGFAPADLSGWNGYSALTPGSAAQLGGGSPGTMYSTQKALMDSANYKDAFYHRFDFPAGTQYTSVGNGSAVNASGANYGTESTWGLMDMIYFAKQMGKPIAFPETGYWTDNGNNGVAGTSAGVIHWAANPVQYANPGKPDTLWAGYLKSRIAFAQSLGVQCLLVSWNFYNNSGNGNDPYIIKDSSGNYINDGRTIQDIAANFGGTGVPLNGWSP